MKRIAVSLLLLSLCLTLCACGESSQNTAASVPDRALPVAEAPAPGHDPSEFYGEWVDLLNVNGVYTDRYELSGANLGDLWTLSDDDKIHIYDYEFSIEEYEGIPSLICRNSPYYEFESSHWLVHAEDYQTCFSRYFQSVELTVDNMDEYLSQPIIVGDSLDESGNITGTAYLIRSLVYDTGLVFAGADNCWIEYVDSNTGRVAPFCISSGELRSVGRTSGTLVYVKADYVQENTIAIEEVPEYRHRASYRVLTLTNGCRIFDYCPGWENTNANYDDWKY